MRLCESLGTWNVRKNKRGYKKNVVDVLRKGKSELLAFTETKIKVNEKVSWFGVNGMIAGVQEIEKASEGVAVLMNDR